MGLGFASASSESNPTIKIEAPNISYQEGYEISVLNHCKERGFIRPLNPIRRKCRGFFGDLRDIDDEKCQPDNVVEIFLKIPIFTFHIIDLGHERYFHKIHYEKVNGHQVIETELDFNGQVIPGIQRKYKFNIPKCQINMIQEANKPFLERKSNPQETMVYTALYQRKISVVDLEKYSMSEVKDGTGNAYSSMGSDGIAKLSYQSPNCEDGQFISVDADQIYEDVLAAYNYGGEGSGSGRYFGGEGSGSGIVKIDLHLPHEEFSDLRFKANAFERLFGKKPKYHEYLVEGAYIPDSLAKIRCLERGEDGK